MNLFILSVLNFIFCLNSYPKKSFHVSPLERHLSIFYWLLHDDTENITNSIKWTVAIETFFWFYYCSLYCQSSTQKETKWKRMDEKRRSRICDSKANIGINLFSHICECHEHLKEREMTIVRNYLYDKSSTNRDFFILTCINVFFSECLCPSWNFHSLRDCLWKIEINIF